MMKLNSIIVMLRNPELFLSKLRAFYWNCRYHKISKNSVIGNPYKITPKYIQIADGVSINKSCRIEGISKYEGITFSPILILAENVSIQQHSHITFADKIVIGSNTAIAANVTITDIDHSYEDISLPVERQKLKVKPVIIGKDCKIYNNAVILHGSILGNHCVVGANSVVKGIIPDYCVVAGSPACIVKRFNKSSQRWEKTNPDGSFK